MRTALLYLQLTTLTAAVTYFALDLGKADLNVPIGYASGGDLHFHLMLYKTIADTGWFLENPWLGAPGVMKLSDFPYAETGLFIAIRLLIAVLGDPFMAANIFYIGTFFLTGWAALFALRTLGVHGQSSVAAALLFAFLPYHFWRGPFHPQFSQYYSVPLFCLVATWLCSGEPVVFGRKEGGKLRRVAPWPRTLTVLISCLLTALGGPYHAAFGTFLLAVGGLIGLLRKPSADRVLDAALAIGLTFGGFLITLVPFALHAAREGANPVASKRPVVNYYQYSLRVVNLLRPVAGHRLAVLGGTGSLPPERTAAPADLTWLYNETNEAEVSPPLGMIGAFGFLVVSALGLAAPCAITRRIPTIGDLGKLNIAAVLLGVLGGFSEILALYVSMKIRCYNRISIAIGFVSLAGLSLLVSRPDREAQAKFGWGWLIALWVITGLGLLDQIPPVLTPNHARDSARFRDDQAFFKKVEAALPANAMVFQLPPNSFPEFGRHFQMYDYNHFRGYLHSRKLRWSYGALRGREVEKLQSSLAPLPPPELVKRLAEAGFSAIYVNRQGHEAGGPALVQALRGLCPGEPIPNGDGSLLLFRLPTQSNVPASN